jgi:RluA family pseudouridine synthase
MIEFNLNELILYEDKDLIALNKPSGVLSIEDGYDPQKFNLRVFLREAYGSIWAIHRLDKDTSGVILFAKNEESHRELNLSFSNRETQKNYRGIVNGFPVWDSFEINLPLIVNGDRKHRTVMDLDKGKPAYTKITKITSHDQYSYIDIFPNTGLTHQIRAHLSAIGFPIFGDNLYWRCCDLKSNSKLTQENFFLHAMLIKFNHPISKIPMLINAPLPTLFSEMLVRLKLKF